MMKRRKAHAAGLPEIGVLVPAGYQAEGGDEIEEPAVGAALEQYPVPLLVQLDRGVDVSAGPFQPPGKVGEEIQAFRREISREPKRQRLELREDGADIPELATLEWPHPEPAAGVRVQQAVLRQAEKRFADRRAADAELGGESGVADSCAGREFPVLNEQEELLMDLMAERVSGYHGGYVILYSIYCIQYLSLSMSA